MAQADIPPLGVLAPEHEKKRSGLSGLFSGGSKPKPGPSTTSMDNVIEEVNNASRRVRVLEDRYTNMRAKLQLIESNLLDTQKKFSADVKAIQADVLGMKRTIAEMDQKVTMIVKELKLGAKKEDVQVLQKYLDLWEPVKFVTHDYAERMINDAIERAIFRLEKMHEKK